MAKYHNISGELTQELLAPGANENVSSISISNVVTFKPVYVDLFVKNSSGSDKTYFFKNLKVPSGASFIYDLSINNRASGYGLYVKLKAADKFTLTGTIDPAASTSVTGVGTLFTKELTIGDSIVVSGETRVIGAISSDTVAKVSVAFSDNGNDTSPDCIPTALVDITIY